MSKINPFVRGYSDVKITRIVAIDYGSEFPLAYRPLHPSFEQFTDNDVTANQYCLFNDDYAYLLNDETVEFANESASTSGQVRSVCYQLTANLDKPVHLGDFVTRESAVHALKNASFTNGFFSRCWEISNAHVSESDYSFLFDKCGADHPFIECFLIGDSTIGLKLICTPWDDSNLRMTVGYESVSTLKKAMLDSGLSEALIDLLFLASQADVRFLILDPDASPLEGLPVFDW